MPQSISIQVGQCSIAGRKEENEDSLGVQIPEGDQLQTKGIAAAICDGMSACEAGKEASALSVQTFLTDYFSTPESWTVKTSVTKVMTALNSWLYSQGQRKYESAKGMVTTFSGLIIKSNTAHLFHIGDSRIYRYANGELEALTNDHRVWLNNERDYLSRALGIDIHADIDYRRLGVELGDQFLLTTDGVHDFLDDSAMAALLKDNAQDLDAAASQMVEQAYEHGSKDNISCLILKLNTLPTANEEEFYRKLTELPFPPDLEPGMILDGYKIIRELHASKRTQVYLAEDQESAQKVIIKTPSVNFDDDAGFIDRFLHEEWVGRRIDSLHVLKTYSQERKRQFLYYITEYIEGQTLRQWMNDHPRPKLTDVREIIRQIAAGLRAFHRLEMIHQDLKPENIMIDRDGTVKLIDFGSTKIAGIEEMARPVETEHLLGTLSYAAPEYHDNQPGTNRSDIFSLAVICYEMLTGHLPYGEIQSAQSYRRQEYSSVKKYNEAVPEWMNAALRKALSVKSERRYDLLSEFVHDIEHPNATIINEDFKPLLERNPLIFWKGLALLEGIALIAILVSLRL